MRIMPGASLLSEATQRREPQGRRANGCRVCPRKSSGGWSRGGGRGRGRGGALPSYGLTPLRREVMFSDKLRRGRGGGGAEVWTGMGRVARMGANLGKNAGKVEGK